jgi:mannosyltransferase OCH1-like enzyme
MRDLDPLLYYPTWTTDGGCGALSNNIFGSVPNHPFWVFLTNSLMHYNYNYFFPYITISYASGQWFETAVWQSYHETHNEALHRLNMDERPGAEPYIFFSQARGGSWNNWDNYLFLWLGDNLAVLGFGLVALGCLVLWLARRCTVRRAKTGTVWGFKRRVSTGRKLDAV